MLLTFLLNVTNKLFAVIIIFINLFKGWCSASGSCVSGNSASPMESCSGGYSYGGAVSKKWFNHINFWSLNYFK